MDDKQNLEKTFKQFKYEFSKSYESSEEDSRREQIFRDNMLRVYEHNLKALDGKYSYTLRVGVDADLTPEEFRPNHTRCLFALNRPIAHNESKSASVDSHTSDKRGSVDWRHQGVNGPVRDQLREYIEIPTIKIPKKEIPKFKIPKYIIPKITKSI